MVGIYLFGKPFLLRRPGVFLYLYAGKLSSLFTFCCLQCMSDYKSDMKLPALALSLDFKGQLMFVACLVGVFFAKVSVTILLFGEPF